MTLRKRIIRLKVNDWKDRPKKERVEVIKFLRENIDSLAKQPNAYHKDFTAEYP